MIQPLPKPSFLPPHISVPLDNLVYMSAAIPYRVDGVAVIGDGGERAPLLPTSIGLDSSRKNAPNATYAGSALLSDVLDSSPALLAGSELALVDRMDAGNDAFLKAAADGASVKELIGANRGESALANLAYTYQRAAYFLERLEVTRRGLSTHESAVESLLSGLSPTANAAAVNAYSYASRSNIPVRLSIVKHCALFIAGALLAHQKDVDHLKYAMRTMGKVSDYFESINDLFPGSEGLAVKASVHETMAEIIDVHGLLEKDLGWGMYAEHFLYGAAKAWRDYLLANEKEPHAKGIYMRALNAAQSGRRYDVLADIFRVAAGFEARESVAAQFLVRSIWAMLKNYPDDRPDAEKWHEVSMTAGRIENLFQSVKGYEESDLVAAQARILSTEAYEMAEDLAAEN